MSWQLVLSGLLIGALVGLTGMGGGSLMTPLLILLFGVHPATAVGTDLIYAAATKTGGSLVHGFATLEIAGGFGLPLDCDESFRRLVDMFIRGLQLSANQGEA